MTRLKAYIICFRGDTARRQLLKQRFGSIGLAPHFIDAVRGAEIPDADKAIFNAAARQSRLSHRIKDNAIGCVLSHHRTWQTILDHGDPFAFVFEDDAVIMRDHTLAVMKDLVRLADRLDIVSLANRRLKLKREKISDCGPHAGLYALKGNDIGSESYFITAAAAKKMLGHPLRHQVEIDMQIHHWWHHDCQVLHLMPPLFTEESRPSSIGYGALTPWDDDSLLQKALRRINRIRASFCKRIGFPHRVQQIRQRFHGV